MEISEMVAWAGSAIAFWAAFSAFLQNVLPPEYTEYIGDWIINILSPYVHFEVYEFEGETANELYRFVQLYLSTLTSERARRSRIYIPKNSKNVGYSLSKDQYVNDTFAGVKLRWLHKILDRKSPVWKGFDGGESDENRYFELKLPRKFKGKFLEGYISSIVQKAKDLDKKNREPRLYSNKKGKNEYDSFRMRGGCWNHIPFRHPASFDTIAMEQELKDSIVSDLDEFVDGKEFYHRVGRAWKRGYLLYGPPGTGKTSLVAAMANKLQYDIYDLELTTVKTNSQLRELLVYTDSKSIIVIEDIDCSLDLSGQRKKKPKKEPEGIPPPGQPGPRKPEEDPASQVTLSGLLNFTDGLWSASENERIFVFTTNFVNKLDPALLRSGRMDMHIHLSYCTFEAFRALASSYFQIKHHALYAQVEELFNEGSRIVPSEAAEVMMRNRRKPDVAMEQLVELLREKLAHPPPPEPKVGDYVDPDKDEEDVAAVKPTDDKESSVKPTDDKESSVKPTDDKESSVKPTDDKESSVKPTDDKEPSVKPTVDKESSVKPTDDKESSVKPTDDKESSVKPTDDKEPSVS